MDDWKIKTNMVHLAEDTFSENLTEDMLNHIASCDYCAERFADYTQKHMLLNAPQDMAESILKRSRQLDVQVIAKSNEASKRLLLILYSLKVGAAALAAIMMMLKTPALTGIPGEEGHYQSSWHFEMNNDSLQKLSDKWNQLSIKLFELEDNIYD